MFDLFFFIYFHRKFKIIYFINTFFPTMYNKFKENVLIMFFFKLRASTWLYKITEGKFSVSHFCNKNLEKYIPLLLFNHIY